MQSDLKQRIPTALAYVVIIAGAFLFDDIPAIVLLWIFYALCLYEFLTIEFGSRSSWRYIIYTILGHSIIVLGLVLIIPFIAICSIAGIVAVLMFLTGIALWTHHRSLVTILPQPLRSTMYLTLPFMLVIYLVLHYDQFRIVVLGSFIIIWLNDAGAYFIGRAFGKTKILPEVSPGKSWEGWFGGILSGIISALIIAQYFSVLGILQWIQLAILLGVFGLVGDLTESAWKRSYAIKDSSTILPGHGGFLDRLDSFIYSLPFIILFYVATNQLL